jgi:hypothetical protein
MASIASTTAPPGEPFGPDGQAVKKTKKTIKKKTCMPDLRIITSKKSVLIDLHINNCTALSVKILDNVPQCTP